MSNHPFFHYHQFLWKCIQLALKISRRCLLWHHQFSNFFFVIKDLWSSSRLYGFLRRWILYSRHFIARIKIGEPVSIVCWLFEVVTNNLRVSGVQKHQEVLGVGLLTLQPCHRPTLTAFLEVLPTSPVFIQLRPKRYANNSSVDRVSVRSTRDRLRS